MRGDREKWVKDNKKLIIGIKLGLRGHQRHRHTHYVYTHTVEVAPLLEGHSRPWDQNLKPSLR